MGGVSEQRADGIGLAQRRYRAAKACGARRRDASPILLSLLVVGLSAADAWAAACKPAKPKPAVVLKSMGPCEFDLDRLSFAGEPVEQAACLMRPVRLLAHLGPKLQNLPPVLSDRIGRASDLPARQAVRAVMIQIGYDKEFGAGVYFPVSNAGDGDPAAPFARYFLIHDTSGPIMRGKAFPADIDTNPRYNNLGGFRCSDGWEIAHAVINRMGDMFSGHDFGTPWRATKFERATQFGLSLKGLFLHVELIQPRRGRHGTVAPTPGFTRAQYDRLALLYVVASVRAERWMIPGFHAPIDRDVRNGHDDPQNFEVEAFAESLQNLLRRLETAADPVVSSVPDAPY